MVGAAASLLAPLVAADKLYGVDYSSFLSQSWGLFPQAVAITFLLLAVGCADRALRRRGSLVLAGMLLGCTFLSHFMYGYMGALSIVLLGLIRRRLRRVVGIGAVAVVLCLHQIVPLLEDGRYLNHSRWEEPYKWNSFGAEKVLRWLFTGQLLDFGRLPVLSVLALAGLLLAVWKLARLRRLAPRRAFLVSGAVLWAALYCGRPTWGRALAVFGISRDFPLHRLIGAVQIFLVLLAATGLAALWSTVSRRLHWGAAVAATAALLYPAVAERAHFFSANHMQAQEVLAEYENLHDDLDSVTDLVRQRGGRVYPLNISPNERDIAFWIFLESRGLPIVPQLLHAMDLTSEMTLTFQDGMFEEYRQFNVRTFVLLGQFVKNLPLFFKPLTTIGSLKVYEAP
jgi:hypothetical protein